MVVKSSAALETDEVSKETSRIFSSYASVEIVDLQGDVVNIDELSRVMDIWFRRGAVLLDSHSSIPIGRGLEWGEGEVQGHRAIWLKSEIFSDYDVDNWVWEGIQDGEYTGLSIGGFMRESEIRCNDKICWNEITKLDLVEISVVWSPANQLALIYQKGIVSPKNYKVKGINKMTKEEIREELTEEVLESSKEAHLNKGCPCKGDPDYDGEHQSGCDYAKEEEEEEEEEESKGEDEEESDEEEQEGKSLDETKPLEEADSSYIKAGEMNFDMFIKPRSVKGTKTPPQTPTASKSITNRKPVKTKPLFSEETKKTDCGCPEEKNTSKGEEIAETSEEIDLTKMEEFFNRMEKSFNDKFVKLDEKLTSEINAIKADKSKEDVAEPDPTPQEPENVSKGAGTEKVTELGETPNPNVSDIAKEDRANLDGISKSKITPDFIKQIAKQRNAFEVLERTIEYEKEVGVQ